MQGASSLTTLVWNCQIWVSHHRVSFRPWKIFRLLMEEKNVQMMFLEEVYEQFQLWSYQGKIAQIGDHMFPL